MTRGRAHLATSRGPFLANRRGPFLAKGQRPWGLPGHKRRLPQQPSACHKQWVKKKPWLQQKAKLEPKAYQFARENMQYPRMLFNFFVSQHYYWSGRGRKRVSTWREPVRRPRKLGEIVHSSMEESQRPSCQFPRADQLAPLQVPLQGACQFAHRCLCSLPLSFHQQLPFQ